MDYSHVTSRLASLLFVVFALVGCGTSPFGSLRSMQSRSGGGATLTGEYDNYDGLAERDDRYFVSVELDDDGHTVSRKNIGTPPAGDPAALVFRNGTTLDVLAASAPTNSNSLAVPLVVRGLDGQSNELWRVTLPIDAISGSCTDERDSHGNDALILAGYDWSASALGVVELNADGAINWQTTVAAQ
ncbi:MAG TPA: hypothetical protein VIA18_16565 [Polyangia bacterium]|nr:hypothetical protein [Polyangia bacterium]